MHSADSAVVGVLINSCGPSRELKIELLEMNSAKISTIISMDNGVGGADIRVCGIRLRV